MTQVVVGAGSVIIGLAAVVAGVGVLARSPYFGRPVRWLWRRNVSEPVGRWNRSIISDVVDDRIEYLMHHRNNGSSLLDLAEKLDEVDAQVRMRLSHDAERDTEGKRYSSDPPAGR